MVWAAGAGILVGLVLLGVGLRGRRIDRHPLCRRCRFDLSGLWSQRGEAPLGLRCPECGATLGAGGTVRVGHRRRRRWAVGTGSVLLLGGLGAGGAIVWARASGFDWNTVKPAWWLLADSASLHRPTVAAAVAELTDRLRADALRPDQIQTLVVRGLSHQADQDQPWIKEWGTFVEQAWTQGLLTPDQRVQYVRNAVSLDLAARPRVVQGQGLPVRLSLRSPRMGGARAVWVHPLMAGAEIGGATVPSLPALGRYMLSSTSWGASLAALNVSAAAPGSHVLTTYWTMRVSEDGSEEAGFTGEWSARFDLPVTVLPEGSQAAILRPDESLRRRLEAAITAEPIRPNPAVPEPTHFDVGVRLNPIPVDVAFDVHVRAQGREWRVGAIQHKGGGNGQHVTSLTGAIPGLRAETVEVVLRASAQAAAGSPDIFEIWDGEIVLRDVPVKWPAPRAGKKDDARSRGSGRRVYRKQPGIR